MKFSLPDYFYYIFYLHKLNRSQWQASSKIRNLQDVKFKNLIKHAYCNVSYYRKTFDDARIFPSHIQTIDDIQKIPITSRQDFLRYKATGIISKRENIDNCVKYTTSGTTNNPLEIYFNKKEEALQIGLYLRMLFANGYKKNDRLVVFTHPQFIRKKKKHIFRPFGIFNIEYLSIFHEPSMCLDKIIKIKPDIIRGYTPIIKAIALEIKKRDIRDIRPRLIFCTAEFLSKEDREFIGDVFNAEVVDYYSSSDCGLIAWECREHLGYHINNDTLIVELLKNGRNALPGEEGDVIITNLDSYVMPFIRYRIGDLAVPGDSNCSCGRGLPLIKAILERTQRKQLTNQHSSS